MLDKKRNLNWIWLSLIIIGLDQLTKMLIIWHMQPEQFIYITTFFNLAYAHNTGAAFSLLADATGWQQWLFGIIAVIVSIVIISWIYNLPQKRKWLGASLSFILGGAIGNLLDRLIHGYVIDFLDLHYKTLHWPTFNFADSMVVIGTIMLIIEFVRHPR